MLKIIDFSMLVKKRVAAVALVAMLLLPICVSAQDVAVRVNDAVFTVSEVQRYADESAQNIELMTGMSVSEIYDTASHVDFLTDVAEHFVTGAISDAKLKEMGMYELTEEETEALREYARENYDAIWQQLNERVKEAYPDAGNMEAYVSEVIESAGYTMDGIFESGARSVRQGRLIDAFCGDVLITEEEAVAFYEENYVKPDREKYENDLNLFEADVLLGGASSAYIPEGYFYIKYITMRPNETSQNEMMLAQNKFAECVKATEAAYQALALAALNEEPTDGPRETYRVALAAEEEASAALTKALERVETDFLPIYEAIRSDMEAGSSFEDEMQKHSIDAEMSSSGEKGFPFHPESILWESHLSEKVSALQKKGDMTGPVFTSGRVVIACRMDDLPAGAFQMSEEEKNQIMQGLLEEKQMKQLDMLINEWRKDFDIEIDISGLVFPGI